MKLSRFFKQHAKGTITLAVLTTGLVGWGLIAQPNVLSVAAEAVSEGVESVNPLAADTSDATSAARAACTISTAQPNHGGVMTDLGGTKDFKRENGRAYISVTAKNCNQVVTLASWEAKSLEGNPYREQILRYDNQRTLTDGTVEMSINIPDGGCFFQIDLVRGADPRGVDGGGAYQDGRMIHSVHGGSRDCVTPPTTTPPTTPPPTPTPTPQYACQGFAAQPGAIDQATGNQAYGFTANANVQNATVVKYDFTFGDGASASIPSSAASASATHTYAPGTYTVNVVITVQGADGQYYTTNPANCQTTVTIQPPTPPVKLTCDDLKATPGAIAENGNQTYSFTAKATAQNIAITGYTFTFDDGQSSTVNTANASATTNHTYAPGDYKASVRVNAANGKTATSPDCQVHITVPPAKKLSCDNLKATPAAIDQATGNQRYGFTASASAKNATIDSYTFAFGDGQQKVVNTSDAITTTDHTYTPGNYTARVTVKAGDVQATSEDCAVQIHVKPAECKPGVPVGSSECSTLACVGLSYTPGVLNADGSQAFSFKASATKEYATITSYVFTYGDSSAAQTVTTGETTATATHTFAASTTGYDVTVAVTGKDAAGKDIQATSAGCQRHITPAVQTPGIAITKVVNGQKSIQTSAGTNFTYTLKVTNNGQQNLTNAVVTDKPDTGINLVSADRGTITNNTWSFTIPALAVGESQSFNLVAVVPTYLAGSINNTACVNAPEVNPGNPEQADGCDTATVTVTPPPATPPRTPTTPQVLGVTTLVNTGPGSIAIVAVAVAIASTVGYRLILGRKLVR